MTFKGKTVIITVITGGENFFTANHYGCTVCKTKNYTNVLTHVNKLVAVFGDINMFVYN